METKRVHDNSLEEFESRPNTVIDLLYAIFSVNIKFEHSFEGENAVLQHGAEVVVAKRVQIPAEVVIVGEICAIHDIIQQGR